MEALCHMGFTWITSSGRERSSQTQFLPVPGVRLRTKLDWLREVRRHRNVARPSGSVVLAIGLADNLKRPLHA